MLISNLSGDPLQSAVQTVFLRVLTKFDDSRHAQLSIYTVFHEESEFEVENNKF